MPLRHGVTSPAGGAASCSGTGVHWFVAALARQSRAFGWEVAQLDPPHRASRYFRHGDGLRSVHPDAFGFLR